MKYDDKKHSKQPRKQRKALYNAPLHQRARQLHSHLSKELRAKEKKRCVRVHKGDKVKVMRGIHKKHSGAVIEVDLKRRRVFVEGVTDKKQGGKEVLVPLDASNLLITELASRGKQEIAREKKETKKESKKEDAAAAMLAEAMKKE
ncbi:50S ribosomal protein L24 [Candidatus Micrarchaeota archaeon CG_4_10_14_0_2_um_filter_60_11]|nr:MAG: 50S ribosomal protein L24 [Candidatus Micrarchaeota archaeon CG1_02_60_51]PIN96502.1 MAG: 50S ribosomal protein L24 [Candidatus Micrarchaeota archaeon CG10_big_fil_rev_8_21_14_0_10_60_32]PIO01874.1 MAG: 50S ribosomal protein L24 [Candidatus Micrarchaeota archaeon CG09_land_8_20_14_0_10_60_16]PIZ90845.1 MAG: 50S ribosomal protein L24 [Candidatus Micrarchaeota archaeon CG_4_10_14_0_2_um_filter_60_11]